MEELEQKQSFFRRLPKGLLVAFSLIVLWVIFAWGSARLYYSTTPNFREALATHPMSQEAALELLPEGELLHEGRSWTLGEKPSEAMDLTTGVDFELSIDRPEHFVAQIEVSFDPVLSPLEWIRKGFDVPMPIMEVREGMRAIVQVSLYNVREALALRGEPTARVYIDILVVAGEGQNVLRIVDVKEKPGVLEGSGSTGSLLAWGRAHPARKSPVEGLYYHARAASGLEWDQLGTSEQRGHLCASAPSVSVFDSASMYSCTMLARVRNRGGGVEQEGSEEATREFTFSGEVW